jgi:hypothetical protein
VSSANAAADLAANLRKIRAKAAGPAVRAAATAAGRGGETAVKMALQKSTHSAGTPTPSPPGGIPSKVSGNLARSILRTRSVVIGPGYAVSQIWPLAEYGFVQEFGMTIKVVRKKVLANASTGQVFGPEVTLPPRPFMRPTAVRYAESGKLGQLAGDAFSAALLKGL